MSINLKHSALNFEAKTVIDICLLVIVLKNNKKQAKLKCQRHSLVGVWFC